MLWIHLFWIGYTKVVSLFLYFSVSGEISNKRFFWGANRFLHSSESEYKSCFNLILFHKTIQFPRINCRANTQCCCFDFKLCFICLSSIVCSFCLIKPIVWRTWGVSPTSIVSDWSSLYKDLFSKLYWTLLESGPRSNIENKTFTYYFAGCRISGILLKFSPLIELWRGGGKFDRQACRLYKK